MKREYIAYKGDAFTLEWYYDSRGRSEVLDYFEDLTLDRKKKTLNLFKRLGDIGKIFNTEKFRYEGDQVYALKPSEDRFLCFFSTVQKLL